MGYRISIISIRYPTIRINLIDKVKMLIYQFVDYRWHPYAVECKISSKLSDCFLAAASINGLKSRPTEFKYSVVSLENNRQLLILGTKFQNPG